METPAVCLCVVDRFVVLCGAEHLVALGQSFPSFSLPGTGGARLRVALDGGGFGIV